MGCCRGGGLTASVAYDLRRRAYRIPVRTVEREHSPRPWSGKTS